MPSIIESMTGVKIKSDFFNSAPIFELFSSRQRVALLYGKNGCGKSTLARGFREYIEPVTPPLVDLSPSVNGTKIQTAPGHSGNFYVFDEDYVTKHIRVKEDGLDAIVLFGEQIELDEQIAKVEAEIAAKQTEIDNQATECTIFTDATNVNAPEYWKSHIRTELKKDTGWAGKGSKIKGLRQNLSVTDDVIERIGQLTPNKTQAEIHEEFDRRFQQFTAIDLNATTLHTEILPISIDGDIENRAAVLLAKSIERPQWTEREQRIFKLLGGQGLDSAKHYLSSIENTICNQCLQPISVEYRISVLHELDSLLNREVEKFKEELNELIIPETCNTTYDVYLELASYNIVRDKLDVYTKAIAAHNAVVKTKIDNPFDSFQYYTDIGVTAAKEALNHALTTLETDRASYNRTISQRDKVITELIDLNDALAHYAIKNAYASLKIQQVAKISADTQLQQKNTEFQSLNAHKTQLDAKRKNFKLAADEINHSLEYIFYCKGRLTLELSDDEQYHLRVNGHMVSPGKVSCGERNALALSYFFTEIASNTITNAVYANEVFLVIDDPVSSFDFENRIGIQSLLRWKLEQVLEGCGTSKVLMMTHDIGTAFDLAKALGEIKEHLKDTTKPANYQLLQLENRAVSKLNENNWNEYTILLERIFEYAKTGLDDGLVIGNIMRRVLEAFTTFSYKGGIESISRREPILAILPENYRDYFKNLMYRLVLHGESHSKEHVYGMKDYGFSPLLSEDEKKRTARDILCYIYLLNEQHVLSHLPLSAKSEISNWISSIGQMRCGAIEQQTEDTVVDLEE